MATSIIVGRNSKDELVEARIQNGALLTNSYTVIRLAAEGLPTVLDDGSALEDGATLLYVDTKAVYIFYKGTWYLQ